MNGRRVLLGSYAALLLVAAFAVSSCGYRQPGRLLLQYPDTDLNDYSKTHPAISVYDPRPKLALEAESQQVADQILQVEAAGGGRPLCNAAEARYFQIKAVYELEQNELDLADRDLKRAEDALHVSCVPPVTPMPAVAEHHYRERHHRHHLVIHHKRHCKCK